MAGFRIGSTELVSGKVKVGDSDVSKIYQGTTLVWPPSTSSASCITIDDRCWTTVNADSTTSSTSTQIQIATTGAQAASYLSNGTPAAFYHQFDSNTYGSWGLFYNAYAANILQPPSGFRLPFAYDWAALRDDVKVTTGSITTDVTTLGADPGGWSTSIQNNSDLGQSGFDIHAYGFYLLHNNSVVNQQVGTYGNFWYQEGVNNPSSQVFEDSRGFTSPPSNNTIIYPVTQSNGNKYSQIRWVKDV